MQSATQTKNWEALPDHSRVWIYQSNRALTDQEAQEIQQAGAVFAQQWSSHGQDLMAAVEVVRNWFIVVFLDEVQAAASGCSIDSSVGFIREVQKHYNIDLLDRLNITYEDADGSIAMLRMADFQQAIQDGQITASTVVFNNLVENKGQFQNSWRGPLDQSWHKQLL